MKILLIVGIQKSMGRWFGKAYLEKIYTFLETRRHMYDRIYMLIECYNYRDTKGDNQSLTDYTGDSIPLFIRKYLDASPVYKLYNQNLFINSVNKGIIPEENMIILPPKVGVSTHEYCIYMNRDLRMLVNSLNVNDTVDIIGGGVDKCVRLTSRLLSYFNINNRVLRSYCYDITYINKTMKSKNCFDMHVKARKAPIYNEIGIVKTIKPRFNFKI